MKLENYYRRLAEKTGTPILEEILKGERPITDLPSGCMPWTGRKTGAKGSRLKVVKNHIGQPYHMSVRDHSYGVIVVEGKRLLVQRYLYSLLFKPRFEFSMRNECGNTLCINPMHWEVRGEPEETPEPEGFHYDPEEPWTQEDVTTLLDQAMASRSILTWEDVRNDILLIDCPEEMLRTAMKELFR